MTLELTIVDVFAEQPLAGNQLAVVRGAGHLSSEVMQDIAREMNFSETTFVVSEGAGRASVRIFTPGGELPFAGHPTLGTAWVLSGGRGDYVLDLEAGAVPVAFADGLGWLTAPPVALGDQFAHEQAAALLGLATTDLDPACPPRFAVIGPRFLLVGVTSLDALRRSALDVALHRQLLADGFPLDSVYLFSSEPYTPDAQFASRMFFVAGGVREDPATGSANCALAAYLRELRGGSFEAVVDQGVEMQRPSRLYLRVGPSIQVGGRTQLVATGALDGTIG